MPLTIKPLSGSGSSTLISVAGTTTNDTLTLPAKTGNIITSADSGTVTQTMIATGAVGKGPAFIATNSTTQSISAATATKVTLGTVVYDTASCFSSSRFTPNVGGFYQINAALYYSASTTSGTVFFELYKNGGSGSGGVSYRFLQASSVPSGDTVSVAAYMLYLNGSTDYLELYGYISGTSPSFKYYDAGLNCSFSGSLVRAA